MQVRRGKACSLIEFHFPQVSSALGLGFCIDLVGESVPVWFLQLVPIVSHSATRAKAILLRKVNIVYSMGSMAASRLDLYSSHAFIREASIMNQKRGCQNFLLRSSI